MIFLAAVFLFLIYLAVSVLVVWLAVKAARRFGIKGWKWGVPAALVMYAIVFWDHIPTLVLHKYYCATKAGFWVYKTPEQWKKENPGVAETLTWRERSPTYKGSDGSHGYRVNQRFKWEYRKIPTVPLFPVTVGSQSIVDVKTGEVMVRRVTVSSGYGSIGGGADPNSWKFWVGSEPCVPNTREYGMYEDAFKKMGREVQ